MYFFVIFEKRRNFAFFILFFHEKYELVFSRRNPCACSVVYCVRLFTYVRNMNICLMNWFSIYDVGIYNIHYALNFALFST